MNTPTTTGPTFQVPLTQLREALAALAAVPFTRPAVPVLGGVVADAGDHGVRLSATDYETGISVLIDDVAPKEHGRILVDRADLARILTGATKGENRAALADWQVTFTGRVETLPPSEQRPAPGQRWTAEVQLGDFEVPVGCLPLPDYPSLPAAQPASFTVDRDLLVAALARLHPAVGRDAHLPVLTGVRAEWTADRLTLVATDRYHLSVVNLPVQPVAGGDGSTVLLPGANLARVAKALPAGAVTVGMPQGAHGWTSLSGGAVAATMRQLDGESPRYRQIIPTDLASTVDVDRAALARLVSRATALADSGTVLLHIGDQLLTVVPRIEDQHRARGATLPADVQGATDIQQGFSGRRLAEALATFDGDRVAVGVQERAGRPVSFADTVDQLTDPDAHHRHVLMSINLGGAR